VLNPQEAAASAASSNERQSLEEIRREARENWLRLRFGQRQDLAESETSAAVDRARDDDLTI